MNNYKKPKEIFYTELYYDFLLKFFLLQNEHTPSWVLSKILKCFDLNYSDLSYLSSHQNISSDDLDRLFIKESNTNIGFIKINIAQNKNTSAETLIKLYRGYSNYISTLARMNPNFPP